MLSLSPGIHLIIAVVGDGPNERQRLWKLYTPGERRYEYNRVTNTCAWETFRRGSLHPWEKTLR